MMSKSILSLSSLVAVALMTASTIGCSKPTHKGQKTFDKDLVGYWAPSPKDVDSPEKASGVEDYSDVGQVTRIDPNGDVFVFDEEKRSFNKIGVVQADGSILLTPEVSKNESGPVSFVLTKIDIDNIKVVESGPESSGSGSGEPVGNQKMVKKDIYFKRFTQNQQDEFNKALAAGTQINNPTTSPGTVGGPSAATPGAFDVDFVGYWVALMPYENPYKIQSGDEISDGPPPIVRVDQNGQVFMIAAADAIENGAQPSEVNVGVVQANGEIRLTPEFSRISSVGLMVLIKDPAGQVHVRVVKAQLDSSGATTGSLQDEFEDWELIKLTEDQFKESVERRTKKSKAVQAAEPDAAAATEVEPPQQEAAGLEEPQVAGNQELEEPSPRIPTNELVEIDPITWEASFRQPVNPALLQ
jgi:hypothetical protein